MILSCEAQICANSDDSALRGYHVTGEFLNRASQSCDLSGTYRGSGLAPARPDIHKLPYLPRYSPFYPIARFLFAFAS